MSIAKIRRPCDCCGIDMAGTRQIKRCRNCSKEVSAEFARLYSLVWATAVEMVRRDHNTEACIIMDDPEEETTPEQREKLKKWHKNKMRYYKNTDNI